MFIINCKNYNEISGEKINKLSQIAEKISKKYKIQMDRKLGYQRLSKLLFRIDHLEISNDYDTNWRNFVVAVDAALWFIPEYPQFLR